MLHANPSEEYRLYLFFYWVDNVLNKLLTSLSYFSNEIKVPSYENLKNRLDMNVSNLLNWRKDEAFYIPSDLHLYSFIYSLPKSKDTIDYDLLNGYIFEYLRRANSYGMTTIYNHSPSIVNGVFNGRCKEQWIVVPETIDRLNIDIKKIKPIRCIWHPFTTMNFWLNENINIVSGEVSFFTINLRELFIVLNYYYKSDSNFTNFNFINRVIFTHLVEDIINITLFNRMYNSFLRDNSINDPVRKKPIWIDLNDEIDQYYYEITGELNKTNGGINVISQNIKLSKNRSIYDFLDNLPRLPATKNITNLYFIALIRYIIALLNINISIHGIIDMIFNNHLKTYLNIAKNDWTLDNREPDLALKRDELFKTLLSLIT